MTNKPIFETNLNEASLFDAGIPHHVFKKMRDTPGLVWNPLDDEGDGFWCVSRFEDVSAVSRDPETYSSGLGHIQIYTIDEDALDSRASMIDMDAPEHTRLRRLVNPGFIPKNIRDFEPIVRSRAAKLLDGLLADGGGDWVARIAKPIPIGIICDMLGVPEEDYDYMIELTDYLVAGTSAKTLDPNAYGNTIPLRLLPFNSPAAYALSKYALELGAKRRKQPKDDMVTQLVQMEVDGVGLTDDEFTNFFRLLIFAGNETTRSAMSNFVLQIHQFPEAFERLKQNPELMKGTVEEIVRYASPILYFRRTATKDTELAGTKIRKGEKIVMWYAGANFDERRFEKPLEYNINRPPTPHVGFGGGGVHTCLGAGLARLELTVLVEEILKRNMRFELTEAAEYVHSNFVNGIESLHVNVFSVNN